MIYHAPRDTELRGRRGESESKLKLVAQVIVKVNCIELIEWLREITRQPRKQDNTHIEMQTCNRNTQSYK